MEPSSGGALSGAGPALGCPWRTHERDISTAIGATLIVVGVSSAAALSWLALQLLVRKPLVATHLLLLQLCSASLACTLLAGFPFTGTSAIAGHWLFGAKGCVAIAVIQHMGVAAQLWTLAGLAMERWLSTRPASPAPSPPAPLPAHWYARALALPWILGAAVAVPPLLGWGSLGCDVSGVWCSVKWSGTVAAEAEEGNDGVVNDTNSFSYVLFAVLVGRMVPATATVWCLCGTSALFSGRRAAPRTAPRPASRAGHHHHHHRAASPAAAGSSSSGSRSAGLRLRASLTAVTRLAAVGILLLRLPRLLLDLHLAATGLPWDRAPPPLTYMAPVADEATALVLPLVCVVVERRLRCLRCCRADTSSSSGPSSS